MKGEITNPLTMVQYIYAIDCPLIYIDVGGEKAEAVDFAGVPWRHRQKSLSTSLQYCCSKDQTGYK